MLRRASSGVMALPVPWSDGCYVLIARGGCASCDLITAFFSLEKSHTRKGNLNRITSGAKMGGGLRKSLRDLKTSAAQNEAVDEDYPLRFLARPDVEPLRAELVGFWERIAEMERRGYTGPAMRALKSQAVKLSAQIEENASRHRSAPTKDAR
jgi:hypothetical protein